MCVHTIAAEAFGYSLSIDEGAYIFFLVNAQRLEYLQHIEA
jgi:hypothetical protein